MAYLCSVYGLIDLSVVLFFAVPQVNSGLVLWVFKFGRILQGSAAAFQALKRRLGCALFSVSP